LVCAIEGDGQLGRAAVERAMKYINGLLRRAPWKPPVSCGVLPRASLFNDRRLAPI